ncbi:MAG: hypothetical protein OEM03_03075 [Chromatiales bacterium]|nr:hypothetical protein [Chromatiales bacterium]
MATLARSAVHGRIQEQVKVSPGRTLAGISRNFTILHRNVVRVFEDARNCLVDAFVRQVKIIYGERLY